MHPYDACWAALCHSMPYCHDSMPCLLHRTVIIQRYSTLYCILLWQPLLYFTMSNFIVLYHALLPHTISCDIVLCCGVVWCCMPQFDVRGWTGLFSGTCFYSILCCTVWSVIIWYVMPHCCQTMSCYIILRHSMLHCAVLYCFYPNHLISCFFILYLTYCCIILCHALLQYTLAC